MKKILIIVSACFSVMLEAREPMTIKRKHPLPISENHNPFGVGINLGSACGMRSQAFGQSSVYPSSGFAPESERQLYGSFGRGLIAGFFLNYMLHDYWGFSVGYNHLFGYKSDYHNSTNNTDYHDEELVRGFYNALFFHFMMRTCCEGRLNATAQFGPSIMLSSGFESEFQEHVNNQETAYNSWKFRNRIGLGISGSVGANYQVTDNISIGLDLGTLLFSGKLKSGELTTARINGTDQLPNMKAYQKTVNYYDEIDKNSNTTWNPNFSQDKARDDLSEANSYNTFTWGIRANFRF